MTISPRRNLRQIFLVVLGTYWSALEVESYLDQFVPLPFFYRRHITGLSSCLYFGIATANGFLLIGFVNTQWDQ